MVLSSQSHLFVSCFRFFLLVLRSFAIPYSIRSSLNGNLSVFPGGDVSEWRPRRVRAPWLPKIGSPCFDVGSIEATLSRRWPRMPGSTTSAARPLAADM